MKQLKLWSDPKLKITYHNTSPFTPDDDNPQLWTWEIFVYNHFMGDVAYVI